MQEFLDFIVDYGFMTVFSGITLYLLYKYFDHFLEKKSVIRKPIDHNFFHTIEKYRKLTVSGMRVFISDKSKCSFVKKNGYCQHCDVCTSLKFAPGRTKLVRLLLDIKFNMWRGKIKEATFKALNAKSFKDVLDIYTDSIVNLVSGYEEEWRNKQIPEIVITKFNTWHRDHADVLMKSMEQICLGKSFDSIEEVCNAILHTHEGMVIQTILDAEKTLGRLNGQLSGKTIIIQGKTYILE